jgi:hypothetical protein
MSNLFGGSKPAALPPPMPIPPPPTIDAAAQNQSNQNQMRQRRGAAANVLAGSNPGAPQTQIAKLLGE